MEEQTPRMPIPWFGLILTFIVSTLLLVSLCLAILGPDQMEIIRVPDTGAAAVSSCGNVLPGSCVSSQIQKG